MSELKVRSFENTTYDELQPGATATICRRVSATEVEALALGVRRRARGPMVERA